MDNSNNETLLETPNPPRKKARHWKRELEAFQEEETWYIRMSQVRKNHVVRAVYENAMNSLVEAAGFGGCTVEDEAVNMAIMSHGLCCTTSGQLNRNPEERGWSADDASTSAVVPCITSTEDILSHAVTTAIRKKGLGALDR